MKVYQDENRKWCYAFRFNKRRYRIKTGLSARESEKAMHAHWERLRKAELGLEVQAPVQRGVLFEDFAKDFVNIYSKKKRRPKTTQSHENSIEHIKAHFGKVTLSDITSEMIDRYIDARTGETCFNSKKKISAASINRELACIKTMFKMAVRWGRMKYNPATGIEKLEEAPFEYRILNDAEIAGLIAKANDELKRLLIVALNTGMRKSEILSLKWSDIKFEGGYITVRAENSKSKKGRNVPMNAAVLEVFRKIPKRSRIYVFFNKETGKHVKDFRTSFLRACRKAEIKKMRIHDLRHTAASKMIEGGIDIVTVSKILGHSDIKITMRYCHPTPENMQKAVDKLGAMIQTAVSDSQKAANLEKKPGDHASLRQSYQNN
jgi:site-specific recombinase XerD